VRGRSNNHREQLHPNPSRLLSNANPNVKDDGCIPYWHLSILPEDGSTTCTNSGHYPAEWAHASIVDYMFHLSAEECCEEMLTPWDAFGGDDRGDRGDRGDGPVCLVVDTCADDADAANANPCNGKSYWDCAKEHECRFDESSNICVILEASSSTNNDNDNGELLDADTNDIEVDYGNAGYNKNDAASDGDDECSGKSIKRCVKNSKCRYDKPTNSCVSFESSSSLTTTTTNNGDDSISSSSSSNQCTTKSKKECLKSTCIYNTLTSTCIAPPFSPWTQTTNNGDDGSPSSSSSYPNQCTIKSKKQCIKSTTCIYDEVASACHAPPSEPPTSHPAEPPTSNPTTTPTTSVEYCGGRKYHPISVVERTCINDDLYPSIWEDDWNKYFFDEAGDCCERFYGDGGGCDVVNICSFSAEVDDDDYDDDDDDDEDHGTMSPGDEYCGVKTRKQCIKHEWCDYDEPSQTCLGNGSYTPEELAAELAPPPTNAPSVTPTNAIETDPPTTPYPTTANPTSFPPTETPTETSRWPTYLPTAPLPVLLAKDGSVIHPSCYVNNPWHLSQTNLDDNNDNPMKDEYCTNDNVYPQAWSHPLMKQYFLFPTIDECCTTNFGTSTANCNVWDVCFEGTSPPATSPPIEYPTYEPWPTHSPVGPPPIETSATTCRNKWHVADHGKHRGNACTNDKVYPKEWNLPAKKKYFLFDDAEECCAGVFSKGDNCRLVNVCPVGGAVGEDGGWTMTPTENDATPKPTRKPTVKPTRRPTMGVWFIDRQIGKCVQSCSLPHPPCGGKRPQWEEGHETWEECCATMPWLNIESCIETPSPTEPPDPTMKPTRWPSKKPTQRPTRLPTKSPLPPRPTKAPTPVPTIDCSVYKWHMSIVPGEDQTCTNDEEYPSEWLSNAQYFLHPTSDVCCQRSFNKSCKTIDWCAGLNQVKVKEANEANEVDAGGGRNQDGESEIDCSMNKWHLSTVKGEDKTCTNSGEFPEELREDDEFLLTSTSHLCCKKAFGGDKDCIVKDWCVEQTKVDEGNEGDDKEGGQGDGGDDDGSEPPESDFVKLDGGEEHFEGEFTMPWDFGDPPEWEIDDSMAHSGYHSVTNIPSKVELATRTLTLKLDLAAASTITCKMMVDISMPFDRFSVFLNGRIRSNIYQGKDEWSDLLVGLAPGENTIQFVVTNGDLFPKFDREAERESYGSGHVWLDDCAIRPDK